MSILVIGGTGTVGREVVAALLARGHDVVVPTPDDEAARQVPRGARGVHGDLRDPASLRDAFASADRAFLLVAQVPDETRQGLNAVAAARERRLARLVYMSVGMPHYADRIPHFARKKPIEQAVRASGIPYTILRPNNFFQNDVPLREAIRLHGVYPQPIGSAGLSRVDARDIGEAAAIALTEDGHAGETYTVVGPHALTGTAVAATYARHLGQPVRYAGDSLDEWVAANRDVLPDWLLQDLRIMYDLYQRHGMVAQAGELERLRRLLGREPRSFDDYVAETTSSWLVAT